MSKESFGDKNKKIPILVKLPLILFFVTLAFILISIVLLKKTFDKEILNRLENKSQLVLSSLNWSVSALMTEKSFAHLQRVIENVGSDPFIKNLIVFDNKGSIIASNNYLTDSSKYGNELLVKDIVSGDKLVASKKNIEDNSYEIVVPIIGPRYDQHKKSSVQGVLYLKANVEYEKNIYSGFQTFLIFQNSGITIMIVAVITISLHFIILYPLRRYSKSIEKIAKGDYAHHIEIINSDELGRFASLINGMMHEIDSKEYILKSNNKILSEYKNAIDETAIVIRSNFSGKINYVNDKFIEISGYSISELNNVSINILRGDDFDSEHIMEYWDTLLNKNVWRKIIRNKKKNGGFYYVNVTVYPIVDVLGEIVEYIDIWHDITEIYELKEELQIHKNNLEHLVDIRTREIVDVNRQLIESNDRYKVLLDEANEINDKLHRAQLTIIQQEKLASIGQLAAGVAHELNNPIGFISSNFNALIRYFENIKKYLESSEEILKTSLKSCGGDLVYNVRSDLEKLKMELKIKYIFDDIKDIFNESDEGFKRVISIINSLRSFSRIDFENKLSFFSLNDGIKSTLSVARNEIKYVAEVETYFSDLPDIECYGGEINQVLLNIIVNAAQAIGEAKKEKGLISIKTWYDDVNVFCSIKDNGSGIPKEYLNRIFDPFFTTKEPGKGTGLGLNISYDIIVNKHHGKIAVDTSLEGTTFTIMLPLRQPAT